VRFVDLSAPILKNEDASPEFLRTGITFSDHAEGAQMIESLFGIPPDYLRDGEGWATDEFTKLGTHNSTHVDAPWHYNSTIAGNRAKTIDELPLEWFHAPGVKLEFLHKEDGDAVTDIEMQEAVERIGHELRPLDIVLIHTGRDARLGDPRYMQYGPGVTPTATHWLHGQGVRVMGIDAWGWDRPLHLQAEDAKRLQQPGIFWAAHQADLEYSQIERLVGLDALPATGFTVSCFPLRLVGGSAAPARVVAMIPEDGTPAE
jgi:kynurenine formamidase